VSKLIRRIGVGVILIAVVLAAIFFHPLLTGGLLALWIFLASREFTELLRKQGIGVPRWLLPLVNLVLPIVLAIWSVGLKRDVSPGVVAFVFLPLAIVWGYVLFARAPRAPKLVYGSFAVLYLSLLPVHLLMLRQVAFADAAWGFPIVLYPLLSTWLNDTGAYGFGKWLGRHKLSPEISPNKTWEGFLAGIVVSAVFSAFYLPYFIPETGLVAAVVLGLVLGVAAQAGDLVESVFKREAGVKDSSSALSEHGGFLDRADSLLFTIPIFYYYLCCIR
jgi:phosphatidate cytidylyltransferase